MASRSGSVREEPGPPVDGLPDYVLRFNASARRIRIAVSPRRGLVVTVPAGSDAETAVRFLEQKRAWVQRALARIDERDAHRASSRDALPHEIAFPAVGERWEVVYRRTQSPSVRALTRAAPVPDPPGERPEARASGQLVVSGAVDDVAACHRALNRFVDARARELLPARLAELAAAHGFRPSRVTVRHQRTRWGSCSTAGSVSLNRQLLFLPPELADAIMLHELAHLRRHDHSPAFWAELEKLDPKARQHRGRMREAWRLVPPWAELPHPESSGDT